MLSLAFALGAQAFSGTAMRSAWQNHTLRKISQRMQSN